MGLDMYLTCNSRPLALAIKNRADDFAGTIEDKNFYEIQKDINNAAFRRGEVSYWRKANQIHNWFVENVQNGEDNCGIYEVRLEDLENLLDVVKAVLYEHSMADKLLPTKSGFFFGSTEYDEYYWEELEGTEKQLEFILGNIDIMTNKWGYRYAVHIDEPDWQIKFFYQSSW